MEIPQEPPCVALKQAKMSFFLTENWRTGWWNRSCLGKLVTVGRGGDGEREWEVEYIANIVYICMLLEKWYLLKLFQK
jgi:hypothetical protein